MCLHYSRKGVWHLLFVLAILAIASVGCATDNATAATGPDPLGALAKQDAMLSLARQGAPGCAGVPTTVSADMVCSDARFTVTGAAAVSVLSDGTFPVVRVKPAEFTNRQVHRLIRQFVPHATLYEIGDVRDKAHVEEAIRALEAQKPYYDAYGIEGYPYMLGILQDELAAAPETVPIVRAKKTLQSITKDCGYGVAQTHMGLFVGESPLYGDPVRYLSVDNSADTLKAEYREVYGQTQLIYEGYVDATAIFDDLRTESRYRASAAVGAVSAAEVPPAYVNMLSFSPEEAARRAERVCKALGFDACAASVTLFKASRSSVPPEDEDFSIDGCYYEVRCTRRVDGAGSVYQAGSAIATGGMDRVQFGSWAFESAVFSMDDLGIFRMEWTSPHTVKETLVQKAALLPFAEIMDRFRQSEDILFADYSEDWIVSSQLTLTRMQLGLVRIPAYDDLNSGLLIPAWAFYGVQETKESDGVTSTNNDGTVYPVLLINAITGEVLHPELAS